MASPSHGDYQICKDAERRLSRMMDEILDPLQAEMADLGDLDDNMFEWVDYGNLEFGPVFFS